VNNAVLVLNAHCFGANLRRYVIAWRIALAKRPSATVGLRIDSVMTRLGV